MTAREIKLYGRIFLVGDIVTRSGLHIGGAGTALEIGGVDNVVIRDPLTNRPYIPGSSLRGKMRSWWEKATGAQQNKEIGQGVFIHVCETQKDEKPEDFLARYRECPVCQVYGVPAEANIPAPTRLIVGDTFMDESSVESLQREAQTDLPYTEIKWEAAIDRVTSAATPRQMERVPANVWFRDLRMAYSVFEPGDIQRFLYVLQSMLLVEDDYLGGQGSRGSGRIAFGNLNVGVRRVARDNGIFQYTDIVPFDQDRSYTLQELLAYQEALLDFLQREIPV